MASSSLVSAMPGGSETSSSAGGAVVSSDKEEQELPTEGATLAIVGAGLPRAGLISSIEPILPHGLIGAGSPCGVGNEEMDPSELLGMWS